MDRLEQLRFFLKKQDFEIIVLTKPANIAAFFNGAQASLGFRQEQPGRIAICVTGESVALLGNRTEVTRVAEDELSWLDRLILRPFRWDEWKLEASVKKYLAEEKFKRVCDDAGKFGKDKGATLEGMYYPLTDQELKNIRELGQDTASIVEAVAKNLKSGETEVQVAGTLTGQLVSRSILPEFIMVAADDRIVKFHHSNPREIPIKRMAFISATVHRRGLYVSLTRIVSLGAVTSQWREHQEICNRIDAKAILLSKQGVCVGDIFRGIMESYATEGYLDEWEEHHQGGPAGFSGRDYKAAENESRCLVEQQPVVWNPTVRGAKSEDTIITMQDGGLAEILTETGKWIYYDVVVDGVIIRRPEILEM
jgi:Xaa-Pro dipeptidase